MKQLIDAAYADAKRLIDANRDKLEALAATLLEKETMDGRDVEALVRGGATPAGEGADA